MKPPTQPSSFLFAIIFSVLCNIGLLHAHNEDSGRDIIGKLKVTLFYGTNGDVEQAGNGLGLLSDSQLKALQKLKKIKFAQYRLLGEDQKDILRSYENWATPMKRSKELLLCFQPLGKPEDTRLKMDLEFWQSHKKIMKSGATLKVGKPLFIQGPAWRGGTLILAVELLSLDEHVHGKGGHDHDHE